MPQTSAFLVFLVFLVFCLSACVSLPVIDPDRVSDMQIVSDRIDSLSADLSEQFLFSCAQKIEQLDQKIEPKVIIKVVERCSSQKKAVKKRPKKVVGKLRLGAVEKVRLIKEKITYAARIDTGADFSSIGVYNTKTFERDSKDWVRFSLEDSDGATRFEYPIFDTIRIKVSSRETANRIEIKIDIKMGGIKYKKQIFNLADRSHLKYQLLIGRSFLRDIAVVDVSRKNIQRSN
ncbi:MAG: ATP-dependent zinc protease [Arenicella sp.]|nr:ATP-dependent zinc protease [Arenicella sp.]